MLKQIWIIGPSQFYQGTECGFSTIKVPFSVNVKDKKFLLNQYANDRIYPFYTNRATYKNKLRDYLCLFLEDTEKDLGIFMFPSIIADRAQSFITRTVEKNCLPGVVKIRTHTQFENEQIPYLLSMNYKVKINETTQVAEIIHIRYDILQQTINETDREDTAQLDLVSELLQHNLSNNRN